MTDKYERPAKAHRWDRDGERCLDCGDKDWMNDPVCVPRQAQPPKYGRTLRDWFAGMALQGMLQDSRDRIEEYLAHDAYLFADAMLAEREKAGSDE